MDRFNNFMSLYQNLPYLKNVLVFLDTQFKEN